MKPEKYLSNKHNAYVFKIFFLCSFVFLFSSACESLSPIRYVYRTAYIAENRHKDKWHIKHYTLDVLENDVLTDGEISIGFAFPNNDGGDSFKILVEFHEVNCDLLFKPSLVSVKISQGQMLQAVGVSCPPYIEAMNHSKDRRIPLFFEDQIAVTRGAFYCLVFNHTVPPIEDEVVLYLNEALKSNGSMLNIPPIHFRKKVQNVYRFGCFQ